MTPLFKAFNLAMAQYGIGGTPGPKNSPSVIAYFKDAGHPEIKDDEVPWCAAFLNAMLYRCGLPGTGSLAAQSFLKWGVASPNPKLGDIVVLGRGDTNSGLGHVGFVCAIYDQRIWILGGNQNNQVEIDNFPKTRVLGFRTIS